jgi:hypothetical protein
MKNRKTKEETATPLPTKTQTTKNSLANPHNNILTQTTLE